MIIMMMGRTVRGFLQLISRTKILGVASCMCLMHLAQAQRPDSIAVYVFLSETCPICQSSTTELNSLYADYRGKGFSFRGLFPSRNMSTDQTRQKFEKKYNVAFPLEADKEQQLAKKLGATITPEVFVIRIKDNSILYRGKVDNSYESMGKRRKVVTEHYLKQALENISHGRPADPVKTESVGCFISKT